MFTRLASLVSPRRYLYLGVGSALLGIILLMVFWGPFSRFVTTAAYTPPIYGTQVSEERTALLTHQGEGPRLVELGYWPLENIDPLAAMPTRDDPPSEATFWGYCPAPRVIVDCLSASPTLEHPSLAIADPYDPVIQEYRAVEVVAIFVPIEGEAGKRLHCSLPADGTLATLRDLPTVYSLFGIHRARADIISIGLPGNADPWTCRAV